MKRSRGSSECEKAEEDLKPTKKIKKSDEAPLNKLISLLKDKNSMIAGIKMTICVCAAFRYFISGLTYFLQRVEDAEAELELIRGYLGQYPECQHFLSPLEWDRDDRTHNVVCNVAHMTLQ